MSVRRSVIASAMLAFALTSAVVSPAPAAPVGAERPGPLRYVALGDSYSAASGVLPVNPLDPTAVQCARSTRNYPQVIAKKIGARVTDVTCGAAETGDFRGSQQLGVAPQLDALRRNTQLVTMTIGGNDSGVFLNSIVQCGVAGATTAGQGSPCKDQYGDSFVQTIRNRTFPALKKALRDVHRKAPRARVAILGYPQILPRTGGCFPTMPVAQGDVPYLFNIQKVLNNSVRRAARKTGSIYVNVPRASRGHDACQPIGMRWVEPALLGTNPVVVHPNALGEAQMARLTMRRLKLG